MTASTSPAGGTLPPVTVARFEQVTMLIERLAQEKTTVFLGAMTGYVEQRQVATARGLSHTEAAAVAAQLAQTMGRDDVATLAAEVQGSGLQASDPPESRELLLAAGLRTAPAFLDVALQVCALIEMTPGTFESAVERGDLQTSIAQGCGELRQLPMNEARPRAAAALQHFTEQVGGQQPGEAWSLLTGTVWQAIKQALRALDGSAPQWSTGLLEPTDGADGTSSTDSPTRRP